MIPRTDDLGGQGRTRRPSLGGEWSWYLRISPDQPVRSGAAPARAVSAGPVDLPPGETRTVPVTWRGAELAGRRLTLEGWNVRARSLG
ncbi:MAG: hypothetical protein ACJ73S_13350 [Mycobacteriales bacterium]